MPMIQPAKDKMIVPLIKFLYFLTIDPFLRCITACFQRKTKRNFTNDIVLVTGGAQGLGKEMAVKFAENGAVLVLWDINEAKLMETCSELRSRGHQVFPYVVDCTERKAIYDAANRVVEDVGNVSVLVNNAGIINSESIVDLDDDRLMKLINTNFISHYWTIKSFLPWMMKNNYGTIIAVSSTAAYLGIPLMSDYCASKSAVTSLYESLNLEMYIANKPGVSATCVHPSGINTALLRDTKILGGSVKHLESRQMSPEYAASQIFNAAANRRTTLTFPWFNRFIPFLKLIIPEKAVKFAFMEAYKRMIE